LRRKQPSIKEDNSIQRNINKMNSMFEEEFFKGYAGLTYHNPIGESYADTRTDCEATIQGEDKLKILK
jgi:hypothetical protein